MKLKSLFILVSVSPVLLACHPNRLIRNILENETRRGKMYHEILKNDSYRAQLLDSIRNNPNTRNLLPSTTGMTKGSKLDYSIEFKD